MHASSPAFFPAAFRWFYGLMVGGLMSLGGGVSLAEGVTPWATAPGAMHEEAAVLRHRLVASHLAIPSGQPISLTWEFELQPDWHIYWQNAGDSGLPPELRQGGQVVSLTFPVPEVIALPPITNYGYKNRVQLSATWSPPAGLPNGPQVIPFNAEFLYCKDVCLPGQATLELPLTIGPTATRNPAFTDAPTGVGSPLADVAVQRHGAVLTLTFPNGLKLDQARFLPATEGLIDDSAPQARQGQTLQLTLDTATIPAPTQLEGLLWLAPGQAAPLSVPIPAPAAAHAPAAAPLGLVTALLFGFLAGLMLNLMPCVLPVLSLKVLALVKHQAGPGRLWHSVAYTGGVLASFWCLAFMIIGLQAGGATLGWGFHLQQPLVVAALTLLMLALALNFFGVFEVGTRLTRLAGSGPNHQLGGSFGTGVLAVVVATPCTVPFMGGALAYALTQPWPTTLAVFSALGLGMALPFLLLGRFPGLLRWLPKPGAWMVTFKQALGWPMLATGLWLAYVFHNLTNTLTAYALLAIGLLLGLGLWGYGKQRPGWPQRGWGLVTLALTLGGLATLPTLSRPTSSTWAPWSPAAVAAAQAENRPIFVDFTADWCLTCKVTEATVLNTAAAQALFAQHGVQLLRADWTRQDPTITAALAEHGRKGVPLYLLYRPGASQPEILPQLLTVGLLAERLAAGPPAEPALAATP